MDSFELNKVLGAVLGTCLALLSLNIAAGALFLSGASLRWMGLAAASIVAAVPVIWSILQDYQRAVIVAPA